MCKACCAVPAPVGLAMQGQDGCCPPELRLPAPPPAASWRTVGSQCHWPPSGLLQALWMHACKGAGRSTGLRRCGVSTCALLPAHLGCKVDVCTCRGQAEAPGAGF